MKPIVAIVGRPNAGKTTLFNRITRSRNALVDNKPGATRDRHYGDADWDGVSFSLVDTGGFTEDAEGGFSNSIRFQIKAAVDEADLVLLLLDGKAGVSPYDADLVRFVSNTGKPVVYAANKIDGPELHGNLYEFYSLGIESLLPVSAEHGGGISELLDHLVERLSQGDAETSPPLSAEII